MGFVGNVHLRMQGSVNKTNNVNLQNISAAKNFRYNSVNGTCSEVEYGIERIPKYAAWASWEMYTLECKAASTRPIMSIFKICCSRKFQLHNSVNSTCSNVQYGIERINKYAAWASWEMYTLECKAA